MADGLIPVWMNPERFDLLAPGLEKGFARANAEHAGQPGWQPNAPGTPGLTKNGSQITVTWSDNSNDEVGFRVQREKQSGKKWINTLTVTDVPADTTSATDAPGTGTFGKDKVANAYIRRDTGLRAVMRATKMMAVDTGAANGAHDETPVPNGTKFRYDIDLDNTIAKIEQRFMDKDRGLFRSASEICTVDLFPVGKAVTTWNDFWEKQNTQTGDNMRERPYAHIYPRVTTKSNVFTVHMRCQTIQQGLRKKGDSYAFDEKKDRVLAEYRGSSTIERFVDPNDPDLKDYDYKKTSVDPYYRFRVVDTKHFSPR